MRVLYISPVNFNFQKESDLKYKVNVAHFPENIQNLISYLIQTTSLLRWACARNPVREKLKILKE